MPSGSGLAVASGETGGHIQVGLGAGHSKGQRLGRLKTVPWHHTGGKGLAVQAILPPKIPYGGGLHQAKIYDNGKVLHHGLGVHRLPPSSQETALCILVCMVTENLHHIFTQEQH